MFIDTHAHLNFKAYEKDLEKVIERTLSEKVSIINIGTKYETSKKAVEIAENYENIYASIGLHPIHSTPDLVKIRVDEEEGGFETKEEKFISNDYKNLAKSKKVVAIGEIGLDYYYRPKTETRKKIFKERQKEVFISQLNLAEDLKLPVIIHCRMAHDDIIEILKNYSLNGVIHCFTGDTDKLKKYIDMGFHIGFNGIIFKLDLDKVISICPLEKILIETDCPYLTPPQEGKDNRNEPLFAKHTINKISDIKGVSANKIIEETTKNAKNLFNI